MKEVLPELERWRSRGDRFVMATVVAVRSSSPRPLGAKMLISEAGDVAGSVSGGCVEGAVVEVADRILHGDPATLLSFHAVEDQDLEVGLPCGGEIEVFVEEYIDSPFEHAVRTKARAVEVTVLEGPATGSKLTIGADGERAGSLGDLETDSEATRLASDLIWGEEPKRLGSLFFDVTGPGPRLILIGAVDIAVALSRFAQELGWSTIVIDPRKRFADRPRFGSEVRVISAWPAEAFAELGGIDTSTAVVALTHDSKIDDAALMIALRAPARFVGAMGSRTAQARRRQRLLAAGVAPEALDRLSAPVGLDLGASGRSETALSILTEIIAVTNGREGGRLGATQGPIHGTTGIDTTVDPPAAELWCPR